VNYLAKTPSAWVNNLAVGWVNYLAVRGLKWVICLAVYMEHDCGKLPQKTPGSGTRPDAPVAPRPRRHTGLRLLVFAPPQGNGDCRGQPEKERHARARRAPYQRLWAEGELHDMLPRFQVHGADKAVGAEDGRGGCRPPLSGRQTRTAKPVQYAAGAQAQPRPCLTSPS